MNRFYGGSVPRGAVGGTMPSLRRTNVTAGGGYNSGYSNNGMNNSMNNIGYQNMPNMSTQADPMAVQQPFMQNTMIPHQSNIIWIDNENEILNYPTGRGWQQWFGNKNEQILYIRDTDTNGVIQPIVRVKYEVIEDQPTVQQGTQQTEVTPSVNTNQYVNRNELDNLNEKLEHMYDSVNSLTKTLDNMQDKLADLLK